MKKMRSDWKARFVLGIILVFFMVAAGMAQECSYDKAMKAYFKKDYKTAVTYLKEYVENKPDPHAYYFLGYALYKMKKYPESAKYFKEAYVIDPNISPISPEE